MPLIKSAPRKPVKPIVTKPVKIEFDHYLWGKTVKVQNA